MYSCEASKTCWLRSTCTDVCTQRHDAHSPDCKLYSTSCSLTAEEKSTVCGDKEALQRIKAGRSRRLLQGWTQHLRLKNYKRQKLDALCENILKLITGDESVRNKNKKARQKRRRSTRVPLATKDVARKKTATADNKQVVPEGYRTCVCGTEECKEAMIHYFREIHDCTWPEKFFPWLYVGVPKRPTGESSAKDSSQRAQARSLVREQRSRRHLLFCRHLGIVDSEVIGSNNTNVAVPIHFPLIL